MADWSNTASNAARLVMNQRGLLVSFRFNGGSYTGIKSTLRRQDVNSDQGLAESYVYSLLCPVAQFHGHLPAARKDKIQIGSTTLRILDTEVDAASACVKLNLGSVTQ